VESGAEYRLLHWIHYSHYAPLVDYCIAPPTPLAAFAILIYNSGGLVVEPSVPGLLQTYGLDQAEQQEG
jgi:hypothetical protein